MDVSEVIKTHLGSRTDLEVFLREVQDLYNNKQRVFLFNKHSSCLKLFVNDVLRTEQLIPPSLLSGLKKNIEELIRFWKHQPFSRKERSGLRGRPHKDPEGWFLHELSRLILLEDGPNRGETDWEAIHAIAKEFEVKYSFLQSLDKPSRVLRSLRNQFRRRYPDIQNRSWPARERRQVISMDLRKVTSTKRNKSH